MDQHGSNHSELGHGTAGDAGLGGVSAAAVAAAAAAAVAASNIGNAHASMLFGMSGLQARSDGQPSNTEANGSVSSQAATTRASGRSGRKSTQSSHAVVTDQSQCPITGLPAKYTDPSTGIPYATQEAFEIIQRVARGDYGWSTSMKCFIHPFDETPPADVPEGWLDCTVGRPFTAPTLEPLPRGGMH
ncbi:hypothetical protein BC831DRAFT_429232 [Entophlyctis helioformis]|nr:hypothetical protein BC831DRAFT_429232 [Entophlyctis helioformis]